MVQQNNINTPSYITTTGFYCQFLLPCGYCTRLNKDCPKQYNNTYIHWWQAPQVDDEPIDFNKVTCNG